MRSRKTWGLACMGSKTLCVMYDHDVFFPINKQLKVNISLLLRLLKRNFTSVKNACRLLTRRDLTATVGDETKRG